MTSPTDIGKEPPKQRYTISTSDEFDETFVVERYADYWRRRCERAEGLLQWANSTLSLPPPRHQFYRAGESDCPKDVKASNGELHTLRCRVCGRDGPMSEVCDAAKDELRSRVAAHFASVEG